MSKEDLPPACKQQRFKGVESFLRRLAFNLGNTPSQTEVKIISCIPIDVTDLQQKIITLEKELYETKVQGVGPQLVKPTEKKSDSPAVNISSALYGSAVGKPSTTVSHCNVKPESIRTQRTLSHCCDCLTMQDKSNVSFAYPAYSTHGTEQTGRFASAENSNTIDSKHKFISAECYRNIFKKRKGKKIFKDKLKAKTQLIYYAQTPNNPFNYNSLQHNDDSLNKINALSHTYLQNVFRKHHDPKLIVEEYSDTSHFSKPICRDVTPNQNQRFTNASDVCSCCHGRFQNVDNYMNRCTFQTNKMNHSAPYNKEHKFDNPYDMIPVKEKSYRHEKVKSLPKFENYVNIKCWPEKVRTKYRYHPFIVNYELETPIKRKTGEQYVKKSEVPTHSNIKRQRLVKTNQETGIETSKSCCIDCGDIYKKPVISAKTKSLYKNECVATEAISTNVQINALHNLTDSSVVDNTKTELTLNQIKNILQSVLAEVKTNSSINNATEGIVKKDAMIQKGPSQNNMQGASTLLHSFTYNNSYNANPYLASCSRQIPSAQYCYPGMPCEHGKYLQNFPVFIQPAPGRHMCACYYRSSAHKTSHSRRSTTAGTNTDKDVKESTSKETEKLIKEIYNSMALNMDYPNKDNSVTEYDDFKSTGNSSRTSDTKELVNTSVAVTETPTRRDKEVDVIISPLVSNTTESKLVYTAMSSQTVSQKSKCRDQSIDTEIEERRTFHRLEENDDVERDDDTDESSVSVDSEYTVVPDNDSVKNKKVKTGFLQKVFKSVFKKKKGKRIESETDKSAVSDSDDYETVYSENVTETPPYPRNKRSKSNYRRPATNTNYVRVKRTPYMEQEYRRQWNENLTFRNNPSSRYRPTTEKRHYNQPYWQEYETRTAMIDPIPNNHRAVPSIHKVEQGTDLDNEEIIPRVKKNIPWLKKHIHCGEQWKKLILEN